MLLVFDCGNTRTCIGVFKGHALDEAPLHSWRVITDPTRPTHAWQEVLESLLESYSLDVTNFNGCVISTVVPDALASLQTMTKSYIPGPTLVVGNIDIGIKALIEDPREVGPDLMVNALAAHTFYHGPLIIVDFGTVTTFSVIDESGNFTGCAFVPGVKMGLKALATDTAQLPLVSFEKPLFPRGTNTQKALQSGLYWGTLGQFHFVVDALQKQMNTPEPMPIVVTGGMASFFVEELQDFIHYDPFLTLKGLALVGHQRGLGSAIQLTESI